MGTAHIQISESLLIKLQNPPFDKLITIIDFSDFGDGSFSAFVSSDALPEGFHGVQDIVVDFKNNTIRFSKEVDV